METCAHALKSHIDKYLNSKQNMTLRNLATRSGVPYSNLWRIAQGAAPVDFGTALSVMNVISGPAEVGSFLEAHFPDKSKQAQKIYEKLCPAMPSQLFREALARPMPNQVFAIAATRSGTTRQRIESLFGEAGLSALDELLESEVLVQDSNGRITFTESKFSLSNPDDFVTDFSRKIENFDKSLLGTDGALLATVTETVNEQALAQIKGLLVDVFSQIRGIVESPQSEGNIPVFCGLAMSLLDKTDFSKRKAV